MSMKEVDLREAISCVNYLNKERSDKFYEIGIVTEKIPALSYLEIGTVVVFSEAIEGSLIVEQPNMNSVLKTKNTIIGVPSRFITKIVLE